MKRNFLSIISLTVLVLIGSQNVVAQRVSAQPQKVSAQPQSVSPQMNGIVQRTESAYRASAESVVAEQAAKIRPSKDGSIKFAYLADIHIAQGTSAIADIEASVRDINAMKDIQFVILAGDITEFGSDEEIGIAAAVFARFNKPWFILSGNHDSKWSESGCNTFAKVFGYEFFDFVVPTGGQNSGIRFIGCNSGPNMRMAPALVPRESILKLDSVSRVVPKDEPVIFINHYPLDDQMLNWFQVTGILKRMNTQLTMCGHGHNNMVLDSDGIPAVMGRSNLRAGRAGAGYNIVTIKGMQIDFQERVVAVSGMESGSGSFGGVAAGPKAPAVGQGAEAQLSKTLPPWFRLRMSYGRAFGSPRGDNYSSGRNDSYSSGRKENSDYNSDPAVAALFAQNASSPVKEVWSVQDNSDIGSAALFVPYNESTSRIVTTSGIRSTGNSNYNGNNRNSRTGGKADISYGIVYYANTAGIIKAVRVGSVKPSAKDVIWSYATGGKIFSSPAVESGRLVIGSSDGFIYCLDAINGSLIWKVGAAKSVLASPAIFNGIVYIGASDGVFRAINLQTGRLVWSFNDVAGFVESKAFVDNSGVYFGSWGSRFYALHPKSGKLLWSWTNGKGRGLSPAAVWPVKSTGKSTGNRTGKSTGNPTGKSSAGNSAYTSLYNGSGSQIFFVTPERMTHALDATSGRELWRARGGREAIGISPDASVIYVKTMQDTVIAYYTGRYSPKYSPKFSTKYSQNSAKLRDQKDAGDQRETANRSRNAPPPPADYLANPTSANRTSDNGPSGNRPSGNSTQSFSAKPGDSQNQPLNLPVLWKSNAGFGYEIAPSPITTTSELIFIPTDKGDIFALRSSDGSVAWRYKFSIALINYIQPLEGNRLLVSSMDGKVGILAY